MTFHFRPAKREHTPLIIGIAGPTKSGKTMSAHRLAAGMANGGIVAMINAEGAKGHQYADKFGYVAADIGPPYRPERYTEALKAALAINPAVVIIDSGSHMHDGPGGILEYHEDELDRMAGDDYKRRERATFAAWVKPKAAENEFIYTMLGADCHVILCLRAKEKIKLVTGKPPIDLGWQPIVGDRVAFETLFTLMLPPHSKGVPDLSISEMREPFDTMVPAGRQLSEETGRLLAAWAAGVKTGPAPVGEAARAAPAAAVEPASGASTTGPGPAAGAAPRQEGGDSDHSTGQPGRASAQTINERQLKLLWTTIRQRGVPEDTVRAIVREVTGQESTKQIPAGLFETVLASVQAAQTEGGES